MRSKQESPVCPDRREFVKRGIRVGLAMGLSGGVFRCAGRSSAGRPNIVLITLDTTRADRLGCYGYHRPTSSNLDGLAAESVLYTNAIAPSSWTLPSHASLFTGKLTHSHGARYDPQGPLCLADAIGQPRSWGHYRVRGLAQDEVTLATLLRRAGYATGAVVAGPWMKKAFGLDKGFEFYDDSGIGTVSGKVAKQVTLGAEAWLRRLDRRPFFLFLNYFDPHGPYSPPEGFARAFLPHPMDAGSGDRTTEENNALYDAEILYMDHYVGRLLQTLKKEGLFDETWIIVTADHGELHGEHGETGHGYYLYQEELHVPLFMRHPTGEQAPRRADLSVGLTDVLPMICRRLEIAEPAGIQGMVPPRDERPMIAETYPLRTSSPAGSWRAIYEGAYKFHWNSEGRHMLFNLRDDPGETKNLADVEARRARTMMEHLDQYLAGLPRPGPPPPAAELSPETKEALKSLGYVQ